MQDKENTTTFIILPLEVILSILLFFFVHAQWSTSYIQKQSEITGYAGYAG